MKKILPIALLFILLPEACRYSTRNPDVNSAAEISFKEINFEYGRISVGSPGICTFEFTNTSRTPLILNNVKTSCGCTSPEWPRDPFKYGEKGVITIKYNTNIRGIFRKTISVYSNAKNSPVNLFITGEVVPAKITNKN